MSARRRRLHEIDSLPPQQTSIPAKRRRSTTSADFDFRRSNHAGEDDDDNNNTMTSQHGGVTSGAEAIDSSFGDPMRPLSSARVAKPSPFCGRTGAA